MLTFDKTIKDGYHYQLKVYLENYIVQDCEHTDAYREKYGECCCDSHRYQDQDIRGIMRDFYY